ncbi:hypothetical protein PGB90_001726 [Kerria lacca]
MNSSTNLLRKTISCVSFYFSYSEQLISTPPCTSCSLLLLYYVRIGDSLFLFCRYRFRPTLLI